LGRIIVVNVGVAERIVCAVKVVEVALGNVNGAMGDDVTGSMMKCPLNGGALTVFMRKQTIYLLPLDCLLTDAYMRRIDEVLKMSGDKSLA